MTPCRQTSFCFATPSHREVVARFDGGTITTDAGGLLLHRTEQDRPGFSSRAGSELALS